MGAFYDDRCLHFGWSSESLFPIQTHKVMEGQSESMSDANQPKPRGALIELAVRYFKKEGYKVNRENVAIEGYSGQRKGTLT